MPGKMYKGRYYENAHAFHERFELNPAQKEHLLNFMEANPELLKSRKSVLDTVRARRKLRRLRHEIEKLGYHKSLRVIQMCWKMMVKKATKKVHSCIETPGQSLSNMERKILQVVGYLEEIGNSDEDGDTMIDLPELNQEDMETEEAVLVTTATPALCARVSGTTTARAGSLPAEAATSSRVAGPSSARPLCRNAAGPSSVGPSSAGKATGPSSAGKRAGPSAAGPSAAGPLAASPTVTAAPALCARVSGNTSARAGRSSVHASTSSRVAGPSSTRPLCSRGPLCRNAAGRLSAGPSSAGKAAGPLSPRKRTGPSSAARKHTGPSAPTGLRTGPSAAAGLRTGPSPTARQRVGPSAAAGRRAGPSAAASQHVGKRTGPSAAAGKRVGKRAGLSAAGPSAAGPSAAGLSAAGLSAAGLSAAGLSAAGPSAAGPSAAGPSAAGPSAAGPSAAGPSAAGPSAAGPSAAGPSAAGPSAAGPSAAGPSAARPSAARPSAARPSAARPPAAGPSAAGPSAAVPSAAGPSAAGQSAAGPSAAGPSAAGPSAAGPSAAGPSAAGPSAAGPSAAGPSAAGPSAARPSAARPSAARPSAARPSAARLSAARLSAAGPSAAGPSAAGPSAAGPSAAGPSAAGPSAAPLTVSSFSSTVTQPGSADWHFIDSSYPSSWCYETAASLSGPSFMSDGFSYNTMDTSASAASLPPSGRDQSSRISCYPSGGATDVPGGSSYFSPNATSFPQGATNYCDPIGLFCDAEDLPNEVAGSSVCAGHPLAPSTAAAAACASQSVAEDPLSTCVSLHSHSQSTACGGNFTTPLPMFTCNDECKNWPFALSQNMTEEPAVLVSGFPQNKMEQPGISVSHLPQNMREQLLNLKTEDNSNVSCTMVSQKPDTLEDGEIMAQANDRCVPLQPRSDQIVEPDVVKRFRQEMQQNLQRQVRLEILKQKRAVDEMLKQMNDNIDTRLNVHRQQLGVLEKKMCEMNVNFENQWDLNARRREQLQGLLVQRIISLQSDIQKNSTQLQVIRNGCPGIEKVLREHEENEFSMTVDEAKAMEEMLKEGKKQARESILEGQRVEEIENFNDVERILKEDSAHRAYMMVVEEQYIQSRLLQTMLSDEYGDEEERQRLEASEAQREAALREAADKEKVRLAVRKNLLKQKLARGNVVTVKEVNKQAAATGKNMKKKAVFTKPLMKQKEPEQKEMVSKSHAGQETIRNRLMHKEAQGSTLSGPVQEEL